MKRSLVYIAFLIVRDLSERGGYTCVMKLLNMDTWLSIKVGTIRINNYTGCLRLVGQCKIILRGRRSENNRCHHLFDLSHILNLDCNKFSHFSSMILGIQMSKI